MRHLLLLSTLLLFIGCGEVDEHTTQPQANTDAIDMVIDKSYAVTTGDRVANASSDAQLKIVKDIDGEATDITLILGSAQLILAD